MHRVFMYCATVFGEAVAYQAGEPGLPSTCSPSTPVQPDKPRHVAASAKIRVISNPPLNTHCSESKASLQPSLAQAYGNGKWVGKKRPLPQTLVRPADMVSSVPICAMSTKYEMNFNLPLPA